MQKQLSQNQGIICFGRLLFLGYNDFLVREKERRGRNLASFLQLIILRQPYFNIFFLRLQQITDFSCRAIIIFLEFLIFVHKVELDDENE